jgi:hypothetical protein
MKTFLILSLDYIIMNRIVSKIELLKLDDDRMLIINGFIEDLLLSMNQFFTSWMYRSLELKYLIEKYAISKLNNAVLFLMKHEKPR